MNRRNFLNLSALACVPLPALAWPSADPLSYLSAFCDTAGYREKWLAAPFSMTGHVVASDGKVLCRVARPGAVPTDGIPDISGFRAFMVPRRPAFRIRPFPTIPEWEECDECGAIGPSPDNPVFCGTCWHRGVGPWPVVVLRGLSEPDHRIYAAVYIQRIMSLPGPVTFALPAEPNCPDIRGGTMLTPLLFTWRHGDGLLMPRVHSECNPPDIIFEVEPA